MGKMTITPVGVAMFASLLTTEVIEGKDTGKYSLSLIFDPKNAPEDKKFIELLSQQNEEARQEELKAAGAKAEKYTLPDIIRPFQAKDKETGKLSPTDKVIVKFKSKYPPVAYNSTGEKIELKDVTPGSRCRVEYVPSSFVMPATKTIGATLYLQNIQVVESGRHTSSFAKTSEEATEPTTTTFAKTGSNPF